MAKTGGRGNGGWQSGALVVFTLKLPDADGLEAIHSLADEVTSSAAEAGLRLLSITHLPYNRREFTMILVADQQEKEMRDSKLGC